MLNIKLNILSKFAFDISLLFYVLDAIPTWHVP